MSKAEPRQDPRLSLRTPRARVKGLGASGHGAGHFWLQRLTGMANAPLMLAFVAIIAALWGRPYPEAVALVRSPLVAIPLLLGVGSVALHMRLGMQTIIEDYVHDKGLKFAAVIANTFYAAALAVACLYAILRVGFGGPV